MQVVQNVRREEKYIYEYLCGRNQFKNKAFLYILFFSLVSYSLNPNPK